MTALKKNSKFDNWKRGKKKICWIVDMAMSADGRLKKKKHQHRATKAAITRIDF